MLNGFDILKSLSAVDEHDIADCAEFFNLTRPVSGRKVMKISRTLLIAAIICAMLAVTASAIGLSAYLKHQQELKEHYKVDENQVVNYEEYTVDESCGFKILSCLADGEFYRVYAAVSPISEEEAMAFFRYNFGDDDEKGNYMYINVQADGNANVIVSPYSNGVEYSPEDMGEPEKDAEGNILYNSDGTPWRLPKKEAVMREYMENSYDKESKSLMLEMWVQEIPVVSGNPVALRASLIKSEYDINHPADVEFIRDLGQTLLIPPEYRPLKIYFPEPITLINSDNDVHLIYEGLEISNTTVYILMRSPEADYVYKYDPEMSKEELSRQADYREKWQALRWENDTNLKINFSDGQVLALNGAEASLYTEGIIRGICLISQPSINFNNIESIYIAGQTINISDCRTEN